QPGFSPLGHIRFTRTACNRRNHRVRIAGVRRNIHHVSVVAEPIIKLPPGITAVKTLGKSFTGSFINPAFHKRMRPERMTVMMTPPLSVLPSLTAIQTPHHTAELDAYKNLIRIMQIRLDRPHMMRLRPRRETPLRLRRQFNQRRTLSPGQTAVPTPVQHARLRPGPDDTELTQLLRPAHRNAHHPFVQRIFTKPLPRLPVIITAVQSIIEGPRKQTPRHLIKSNTPGLAGHLYRINRPRTIILRNFIYPIRSRKID